MEACTFFEHRDCYGLAGEQLCSAIEELIQQGVDTFYVGNQGQFDALVYGCLKRLRDRFPQIRICVVLAYLPVEKGRLPELPDTMYPQIEGHPRFAIERRNRYMIEHSDICLCYVNRTYGGAYKFASLAKRLGLRVINLGSSTAIG